MGRNNNINLQSVNQPEEVVFRSLSKIIHEIGNKKSFTRGRKIVSLLKDINSNINLESLDENSEGSKSLTKAAS